MAWLALSVPGPLGDTNPLTDFPFGHSIAQGLNAAGYFMSGNARRTQTRVDGVDRSAIAVTDSARFHPNANLTCSGFGHRPFH